MQDSPLWIVRLKTIDLWASTEVNEGEAYIVVYIRRVWPRRKDLRAGYLMLRAMREPAKP